MRKPFLFVAAAALALLVCLAALPALARAETWEGLSKRMAESCEKYKHEIKDITWTMEMEVPSSEGSFKTTSVMFSKGNRYRVEVSMEGMEDAGIPAEMAGAKTIVIGDGTDAWIVNPLTGTSKIPVEEGAKYRGQWTCGDYMPVKAQIVGTETVGGHECYVLSVLDESSDFAKLWIDQKSLLLVKMEGKPQGGVASDILLSDFRKVSGDIEMPFKIEMYSGKDLISTSTVKSIAVNKGMADSIFDPKRIVHSPGEKGMVDKMKEMREKLKGD